MKNDWKKAEKILKKDGIAVIPTDTLYGIVGKADSKKVVEQIYKIKGRNENKPFIVLITSFNDLEKFEVNISKEQLIFLKKNWPGKLSVVLPCQLLKFKYLHRGSKSIAFRMIGKKNFNLYNLIKKVGSIVAPSTNPSNGKPAENVKRAKEYFGDKIDMYVNGGKKIGKPSTLIKFENDKIIVLREGSKKIKTG